MMGEEGLIRTLCGGGELAVLGYGLEIYSTRGCECSQCDCRCGMRIPMADVVVRVDIAIAEGPCMTGHLWMR